MFNAFFHSPKVGPQLPFQFVKGLCNILARFTTVDRETKSTSEKRNSYTLLERRFQKLLC